MSERLAEFVAGLTEVPTRAIVDRVRDTTGSVRDLTALLRGQP